MDAMLLSLKKVTKDAGSVAPEWFLLRKKPFTRLRRLWQGEGGGGPPVRGMSRSDKGCAGSGEDGKVTSGQDWL